MANKGLRHLGSQGRNPMLIIGYNAGRNEVAVIDLKLLRPEESSWLVEFMSQPHVYNARTLSESLNQVAYTQGTSAFAYFLSRATPLPFYEVNISDKDQCHEWIKSDSRYDSRLADHPFINRLRELLEARKNGIIPQPAVVPASEPVRSGSGDVMETVQKFLQESGQAAAFLAKPSETDAGGDKSVDGTAQRLSALEDRFDRIEKLLANRGAVKLPAKTSGKRTGTKK